MSKSIDDNSLGYKVLIQLKHKEREKEREFCIVSRTTENMLGCNDYATTYLPPKRSRLSSRLTEGPNIAFFKSTGTSNEPKGVRKNDYSEFDKDLKKLSEDELAQATKDMIMLPENELAQSTFPGMYLPFAGVEFVESSRNKNNEKKRFIIKMNRFSLLKSSLCDFIPKHELNMETTYLLDIYFNCYSEAQISAALGGDLWNERYKSLQQFLLNKYPYNDESKKHGKERCIVNYNDTKISKMTLDGFHIEILDLYELNLFMILYDCVMSSIIFALIVYDYTDNKAYSNFITMYTEEKKT